MTTAQLQQAIHAQPFRPFTLHTSRGRAVRVPHRDFIAHTPNTLIAVVTDEAGGFEVVDLMMVSSLQVDPATSQGGRRRRRP